MVGEDTDHGVKESYDRCPPLRATTASAAKEYNY